MAKRTRLLVFTLIGMVGVALTGALVYRDLSTSAFRNPVLDHDAPDPSVIRGRDGLFYAYTTQSGWPTLQNIPILRSTDLLQWEFVGDAFPVKPRWVTTDMWAPHITKISDNYLLYYSARQFGRGGFAIGVARSPDPLGPFRDRGRPLLRGPGFTTIDPFVYTTKQGRHYIYWGSDGAPIRAQELSADGMSTRGKPQPLLYPSEREYEGLLEGAWLLTRGDWYYLMYSGDACCEPDPHYAVMVARSRSPLGPFERYDDNPILEANEHFDGPGHNATIRDSAGRDWIVYHAFERGDVTAQRKLMLDLIEWEDGWPVINDGAGPSQSSDEAPVVD